jgi:hypothetical protein
VTDFHQKRCLVVERSEIEADKIHIELIAENRKVLPTVRRLKLLWKQLGKQLIKEHNRHAKRQWVTWGSGLFRWRTGDIQRVS